MTNLNGEIGKLFDIIAEKINEKNLLEASKQSSSNRPLS